MKIRGVNLGNWLSLEKWMKPELFDGIDAEDELDFFSVLPEEEAFRRIREHYETYITEEDFASLESCGYHVNDYVKLIAGLEDTFASVSFLNVGGTLEELKEKIEVLFSSKEYGNIYRVKGFIAEGQGNYEINATLEEVKVTDSKVGQGTVIVIGTNLNEQRIKELILLSQ